MFTKVDRKRARRKSINDREFIIAVIDEDYENVTGLIRENVNVNFQDRDECTALHLAVTNGDARIVRLLIDKGAALDIKNNDGETPLDIAKRLNKEEIVNIFEEINNRLSYIEPLKIPLVSANQQNFYQNEVCKNKHGVWINPVHGNIYQLKALMLFLYRGVACKYSFRLGTEIKEARKFDDLVFEYTVDGKNIYRILQAKHKIDESNKITVDNLLSETNGDYSLVKYYVSYQASKNENFFKNGTIKDVTICTNVDFDLKNFKKAQIEIQTVVGKDNILDVKSEGKEPTRYKFTKWLIPKLKARLQNSKFGSKCKISNDEIDDFLQHLVFAVNQPNEEELGNMVKNEISKEFDFITTENAYNKFFIQMLDWMKSRDRGAFWSYKDGKNLFEEVRKGMPVWYNVQDPVKLFTGRVEPLKSIRRLMQKEKNAIICVSGPGGVGKSELIKKYIADYSQIYDNKVIWINAESYQTLVDSFRELACEKLGVKTKNANQEEKDINTLVAETYRYFSNDKSLFVFDNAEMYKSQNTLDAGIDRFLPRSPSDCRKPYILVTSRNQKWPKDVKVLVLEAFSKAEAISFIAESLQLKNKEQNDEVIELGKMLQLLPLALQQAVAYIRAQSDKLANIGSEFQINDYFAKLSERNKDILNYKFSYDYDDIYGQTVFTTWNVTLNSIKDKENGNEALNILIITSYFLPDNIPIDLLIIFNSDKEKLASAIELLKQYSLVNVHYKTLHLHRLVQQITRLKNDKEEETLKTTLSAIKRNSINVKNVEHFMRLWSYCTKYTKLVEIYHTVATTIAEMLMNCYRFDEAEAILTKIRELLQKLPNDSVNAQIGLLSVKNSSACILLKEGNNEIALRQFLEIYDIEKVIYGQHDEETLKTKSNIAHVLQKLNRNSEALKWCQEILRVERVVRGENHLDTLLTKQQIANILIGEEKYDEALSMLEQVYNVYKATLGDNHDDTMKARSSIAIIYTKQQRYDEALKIFEISYNVKREMLGENHPDTLGMRNLIANTLIEQGDKLDVALEILEDVLKIKLGVIGENHPEVIGLQMLIAGTQSRSGKNDKAIAILKDILRKQRNELGSYHPDVFQTEFGLAAAFMMQGKFSEALELNEDLLKFQETMVSVDATMIHTCIVNISMKLQKFDKALEHSLKILQIHERELGKNHSTTLDSKINVGMMHYHRKDFNEALKTLTEVQKTREMVFGIDDATYKSLCNTMASISFENQMFDKELSNSPKSTLSHPFLLVQNGDLAALKTSLETGTDLNIQDDDGRTLLHSAASNDNLEIVKFLIKNGADVTRVTEEGDTVLHIAVSKNNMEIADALLQTVSYLEWNSFIDAKTKINGNTALHVASKNGFYKMTRLLLLRGAGYNVKNECNETPLDVARDGVISELLRKAEVCFQLAARNGEFRFEHPPHDIMIFINARDADGDNLMRLGIINNHKTLVFQLLGFIVEVHCYREPNFDCHFADELLPLARTALTELRDDNCTMSVRKLVQRFRSHDKRTSDLNIIAIEGVLKLLDTQENAEFSKELACAVIDTHVKLFGITVYTVKLLEAAKANDCDFVEECIEWEADVNAADDGGWTPLLHAVNAGNEKMVKLLIERDAKVHCATKIGKNTPLHVAVNRGYSTIVEILLRRDRSSDFINAQTEAKGSTAMHVAAKHGRLDIITLLLINGAVYCLGNKDGRTPLALTEDESSKKFFELIDQLFDDTAKGSKMVIHKMRDLKLHEFFAVAAAHNDEGYAIVDFATVKGHRQLAREIANLIEDMAKLIV